MTAGPTGEAPLCACGGVDGRGCPLRVKASTRHRRQWARYASKVCSGRAIGRSNKGKPISEAIREANRREFLRRWNARFENFRKALEMHKAGKVTTDRMIESLAYIVNLEYQRGATAARNRVIRSLKDQRKAAAS